MSSCRAFKMFCKDTDKAAIKEDSPDLEALLSKFVNIEHTADATFLDEENNVSKKNLKVFYFLDKNLEENKGLKTVLGHSYTFDEDQNESTGTWTAVYDHNIRSYHVISTTNDLSTTFNISKSTTSIVAHSSSTTSGSRSNNPIRGYLKHKSSQSCTLRGNCINKVYCRCWGIINEGKAWNNCIDQGEANCKGKFPNLSVAASCTKCEAGGGGRAGGGE